MCTMHDDECSAIGDALEDPKLVRRLWKSSLLCSLVIHGVFFTLVMLVDLSPALFRERSLEVTASLIDRAFEGRRVPDKASQRLMETLNSLEFDFDPELGTEQKVEVISALIEATQRLLAQNPSLSLEKTLTSEHLLKSEFEKGLNLKNGGQAFIESSENGKPHIQIEVATQNEVQALALCAGNGEAGRDLVTVQRGMVHFDEPRGSKSNSWLNKHAFPGIPEEYYFRQSPYDRILAAGAGLFTIFNGFPSLSGFETMDESAGGLDASIKDQLPDDDRMNIIFIQIGGRIALPSKPRRPDLHLDMERQQRILDSLMAHPEGRQFEILSNKYLEKYDADSPALADLVDAFFEKNINGVFFEVSPVATAFDYLEELLFKRHIYDSIPRYWRENYSTRTGGVLLLYLAASYDFERRTIEKIKDAYEEAKKMYIEGYVPNNIFDSRRKALAVKLAFEKMRKSMKSSHIKTVEDMLSGYREQQKRIYAILIESGGINKDRGLWAMGKLLWDGRDYDMAIKHWVAISSHYNGETYQLIRKALIGGSNRRDRIDRITNAFVAREIGDDKRAYAERMIKFGKWKNRSIG